MNLQNWSAGAKAMVAFVALSCALAICLLPLALQSSASPAPSQKDTGAKKGLSEAEISHMNSDQLAHYIFEHHGCKGCHTLGTNGKLGFTQRGKQVGKNFEGCISLLTSMNVIAQVDPANRTAAEKQKAAKFSQFGCTTCHQITPGKMGLTVYGAKIKSMHMTCPEVEKILSEK